MPPPITPGGVLTLDLAGTIGWAYGPLAAAYPIFDRWLRPKVGGEGAFYLAFQQTLTEHIEWVQPSAIVAEAPLNLQAQTRDDTCRQQFSLRAIAYIEAARAKVPISEIDAYTVRLEVFGQGTFPGPKGETKRAIVRLIRARGIDVTDHNEADAIALWLWHKQRMTGAPRVAGPLWRAAVERKVISARGLGH